jgi:hypothetical protein
MSSTNIYMIINILVDFTNIINFIVKICKINRTKVALILTIPFKKLLVNNMAYLLNRHTSKKQKIKLFENQINKIIVN